MITLYLSMINDEEEKSKFENLYLKYKDIMLNRAYDILQDRGLSEDAVHNAFLSILKNLSKINENNSLATKGYVLVITENAAKKIYNKEHKIITTSFNDEEMEISAEDSFENLNSVEIVKNRINSLSDIYRVVMILKFFNGLSDKEIASSLSIPIATVRKRVMRGRKTLLSNIKDGE